MRRLRVAAALLAFAASSQAFAATAQPALDLCPISPQHTSLGILLWDGEIDNQPNGSLVTCTYRANKDLDIGGKEILFSPKCPAGKRLVFPGYNLNTYSRTELRVIGFLPKSESSGLDAVDLVVAGETGLKRLDLNVYALCR